MPDAEETGTENPIARIRERAEAIEFDDQEEKDDWIEARMRRAGFKKGPGEWLPLDDDSDEENEDDDEPVTRGDIRRMRREEKRKSAVTAPPKKTESEGKSGEKGGEKKPKRRDPWW